MPSRRTGTRRFIIAVTVGLWATILVAAAVGKLLVTVWIMPAFQSLESSVSPATFNMIVDSIAVGVLVLPGLAGAVFVALWLNRKPP